MKILFISIDLTMGTRILVNILKNSGFQARNLQITGIRYSDSISQKTLKQIYEFAKEYNIVGLAFNSFYSVLASQIGRYLKSKGIKFLITGGPHPTAAPEEPLDYSDLSVIYEAEITLPKIMENLRSGLPLDTVGGLVFKDRGGRLINTGRPRVENNLDNLPFPSISAEDIVYYDFKKSSFLSPGVNNLFPHSGKNYFIMTSRGCPFDCAYCCNNLFARLDRAFARVRKRSIPNIIEEMERAKKAGFEGFFIADDNFFAFTPEEIESFSGLYKSRINLPFGIGGLNPNNMRQGSSPKKIDLLLECGLSDIRIGVQSGSNKTLKIFKRNYTTEELPGLTKVLENRKTIWPEPHRKLRVAADFICDSPWEKADDKLDTLKLANKLLDTYGIFFYTLIYLPGTDIYAMAVKNGWVKDRERDVYLRGIAGVEDNIYNRLLFLIAVLKERGGRVPDEVIEHVLKVHRKDPSLSYKLIDFVMHTVNSIEDHYSLGKKGHLTIHPYLKGFNKWEKKSGEKGKKVLFRSYHEAYG